MLAVTFKEIIKDNNRQLEEPFFYVYVMLYLKDNSCLESLGTLFHERGFDTLSNYRRSMIH